MPYSVFENIYRLGDLNTPLVHSDILRARVKTLGVTGTSLNWGGQVFDIFDTGGERAVRRKWVHALEGAHCVICVVPLGKYNCGTVEDGETV